uniref:Uncharacterized protein n=1 Tax=Medicago truncatula TaxID=3880 RepID=I3T1D4_MEDTR|nr:unknown [Medicago truncatula]
MTLQEMVFCYMQYNKIRGPNYIYQPPSTKEDNRKYINKLMLHGMIIRPYQTIFNSSFG